MHLHPLEYINIERKRHGLVSRIQIFNP
jgi:hypothetical protein